MGFFMNTLMNQKTVLVRPKVNLFTNNFETYDSDTNRHGINYSSYASGDSINRTITHTATSFSASNAYIFSGFEVGKKYKYSVSISGFLKSIFIRVKCLTSSNISLFDTTELIDETETIFTVPTDTEKIQIFVGTSSGHEGSTTFSNITIEEV